MRSLVILATMVLAVAALPTMPNPGELALMLNEEDFEDYLDKWLENEERKWVNVTLANKARNARSGNGTDFIILFVNLIKLTGFN